MVQFIPIPKMFSSRICKVFLFKYFVLNRKLKGTLSIFARPGEYMSIQLDQYDIPHVVWSDGRNNEMDIYYAYGLTTLPYPVDNLPFPVEIVVVTVITLIIGAISVVVIFRYRHKRLTN